MLVGNAFAGVKKPILFLPKFIPDGQIPTNTRIVEITAGPKDMLYCRTYAEETGNYILNPPLSRKDFENAVKKKLISCIILFHKLPSFQENTRYVAIADLSKTRPTYADVDVVFMVSEEKIAATKQQIISTPTSLRRTFEEGSKGFIYSSDASGCTAVGTLTIGQKPACGQ